MVAVRFVGAFGAGAGLGGREVRGGRGGPRPGPQRSQSANRFRHDDDVGGGASGLAAHWPAVWELLHFCGEMDVFS